MRWNEFRYRIADYWQRHSLKTHIKRVMYILLALYVLSNMLDYFFSPSDHTQPPVIEEGRELSPPPAPTPQAATESTLRAPTQPLHTLMTSQQSMFWWQAFMRMMTRAKPGDAKHFKGKNIRLTYVTGDWTKPQKGLACRPFRERIMMSDMVEIQQGYACRKGTSQWCRIQEGQTTLCRTMQNNTGFLAGITADYKLTMHNLKIDMSRGLSKLPSF